MIPTLRSPSCSNSSDSCDAPAEMQIGDLLMVVIRCEKQPSNTEAPWHDEAGQFWPPSAIHFNFDPDVVPEASNAMWSGFIGLRTVDGTEPSTYTFENLTAGVVGPINAIEIGMFCFMDIDAVDAMNNTEGVGWEIAVNGDFDGDGFYSPESPAAQRAKVQFLPITPVSPSLLIAIIFVEDQT